MRKVDTDALNALSLDDLAQSQREQTRHIAQMQGSFPQVLQSISDQLQDILVEQAQNAERQLQLHQQSLEAFSVTSDLVIAALEECQIILDADNGILESLERRSQQGGR